MSARRIFPSGFCSIIITSIMFVSSPGWSENRALLIGVAQYQESAIAALPGVSVDLTMMADVAQWLGYSSDNVKILSDQQATTANVKTAFQEWLTQGVTSNDRVLIYFSGHGTQIPDEKMGDEEDNADELLVLYDVHPSTTSDGAATWVGGLLDDDFQKYLEAIPAKEILVLVDACHSGTSTKDIKLTTQSLGQVKSLIYKNMPIKKGIIRAETFVDASQKNGGNQSNYVAISAATDDEKAIATKQGSLFTIALYEGIREKVYHDGHVSPRQLQEITTRHIAGMESLDKRHHPQMYGNKTLWDKDIQLVKLETGSGSYWRTLEQFVDLRQTELPLRANRACLTFGEDLELTLEIPTTGYLNVISVDAHDEATVLFPNQFHTDNNVPAGQMTIPSKRMEFVMPAQEPAGKTLIAAFLTNKPTNYYSDGLRGNGSPFASMSPQSREGMARGVGLKFRKKPEGESLTASKFTLQVSEKSCVK